MKKLSILIAFLSIPSVFAVPTGEQCEKLLDATYIDGFQAVWSNGASSSAEEFGQYLKNTFDQFSQIEPKLTNEELKELETKRSALAQKGMEGDYEKYHLDIKAKIDANLYPDLVKTENKLRAVFFINKDAADLLTQANDPKFSDLTDSKGAMTYGLIQVISHPAVDNTLIECNCFWLRAEVASNKWNCSYKTATIKETTIEWNVTKKKK